MEPITITIWILTSILAVAYWPQIVDFFSTKLIPWVRDRISNNLADWIANFIIFADGKIVLVRRAVKQLWAAFKQHVLGSKMEVRKIDATTVACKTTTIIKDENGKFLQSTTEEVVDWDQLPEAIRSEINRQGKTEAAMDLKKAAEDRFRETAQKQGMEMELAT
jgi:hypothetical protein